MTHPLLPKVTQYLSKFANKSRFHGRAKLVTQAETKRAVSLLLQINRLIVVARHQRIGDDRPEKSNV